MVGQLAGHYQVLEKLGEGGMGEVYKARDSRLNRFVALKVLPPDKVSDPERRARFIREARAASALNHPNIVTVHDIVSEDGCDYIVMEYVAGETLAKKIADKELRLPQILKFASQIADALARAHAAGIVHRDLKPSNIMITKDGAVKVLDFGLAKLSAAVCSPDDSTVTAAETSEGVIVGTVSYMSPEQVRGREVDQRSDIFSFGLVLYEMLAGKRAFHGDSAVEVMNAILKETPPELPETVPAELQQIVAECLEKDPSARFQSAHDVALALRAISVGSGSRANAQKPETAGIGHRNRWFRAVLIGAVVVLGAAAGLFVWVRGRRAPEDLKPVPLVALAGVASMPSLSPDGNRVAFRYTAPSESSHSGTDDECGIYVVQVSGGPPVRLTFGESDRSPAWSPDDSKIAFLRGVGQAMSLMLIPSIGGSAPQKLIGVDSPAAISSAISWTQDGRWLIVSTRESQNEPYGIWLISAANGEHRRLLTPPSANGGGGDYLGDFASGLSQDGRLLLFARSLGKFEFKFHVVRLTADLRPEGPLEDLAAPEYAGIASTAWTGDREVIFGVRWGASSGLFRSRLSGGTTPSRLSWAGVAAAWPAIARSQHRLVYSQYHHSQDLWRMDLRTNECRLIVKSHHEQRNPQISPDGRRVAFNSGLSEGGAVWACEANGKGCRQVVYFGDKMGGTPRWSPDSRWLAFDSRAEGKSQIFVVSAEGGAPRRITDGNADSQIPSWSRDSRWIYFVSDRSGQWRVWKTPVGGGEPMQVTYNGGGAAFESASGKYIYYASGHFGAMGLFRMPVGGGEERQVVPGIPDWDSFAVTARGLYFLSDRKTLRLLDEKTGLIRSVARLEGHSADEGITISGDDAFLIFSQADHRVDLMLVEGFR